MPDVALIAVASRTPERRTEIAARYGAQHACADIEAMLALRGIDAVVIASASHDHADQARAAIEAGLHVLVEKPFTTEVWTAKALADAAIAHNVHLQVGFLSRYDTRLRRIFDTVARGALGSISTMLFTRSVSRDVAQSGRYADPVSETMSHDVDLAIWFARQRVTHVTAAVHHALGLDRPDSCSAHMTFANGMSAVLQADWLLPDSAPRNIREGERSLHATCQVIGARGRALARLPSDDVVLWTDDNVFHPQAGLWDNAFGLLEGALVRQDTSFARAARGERVQVDAVDALSDAVHGQEVCAAILHSAANGMGVRL